MRISNRGSGPIVLNIGFIVSYPLSFNFLSFYVVLLNITNYLSSFFSPVAQPSVNAVKNSGKKIMFTDCGFTMK